MLTLPEHRRKADLLLADYKHAARSFKEERQALQDAERTLSDALEARKLLQIVAETVQKAAHQAVAGIVTRCLQTVFGEESYVFKIDFRGARGKTEARFLLCRDGNEIDPMDAAGGGVVDVVSFALRLVALILTKPSKRRLLCLDEPFRFLSQEYRPAVAELVQELAKELDVQFILVTHSEELMIGEVIHVGEDC